MLRIALALLLLPLPALAAPRAYVLDQAASSVGFQAGFGPDRITGSFPVAAAELSIDFAALGPAPSAW
jgi:polyisoprenoid-binding protein YceI